MLKKFLIQPQTEGFKFQTNSHVIFSLLNFLKAGVFEQVISMLYQNTLGKCGMKCTLTLSSLMKPSAYLDWSNPYLPMDVVSN